MVSLSVLDLVTVREGGSVGDALHDAAALAQTAEAAGYKRFWVAEHHAMEGVAGGAVSVVLAHIGQATRAIRIGSGGIMLPNHNPFVIAEQFGTLDALFPGRIDLGLGRAPGADARFGQALRKDLSRAAEYFPQDVMELRALLTGEPELPIRATPGYGAQVEMWMLGSSLFGAQLAAMLGMPYAFASHFAPDHLDQALDMYRKQFRPSAWLDKPYVMAAINVIAAEDDEEAALLGTSMDQSFVALRSGTPGRLRPPVPGYRQTLPPSQLAMLEHMRQVSAIGGPEKVRADLARFVERTGADEIIVSGATYDPAMRRRSLELTAKAVA
ncbi:LLM class flavin-dependent oxidoreductase [Novosphingobium sp. NPDC080210]|uniref:LLM class flavin-dependent oxidoreductase n=1 Tax=Novosphingobium sp. NPDC080210 TaxID=3390596 RepID=UPI003D017074